MKKDNSKMDLHSEPDLQSELDLLFQNTSSLTSKSVAEEFLLLVQERDAPLRIKWGCDPTGDKIHLGHCVVLERLRVLQKAGHQICLVIGSFTGMIGDPTDRTQDRVQLSREEVRANYQNYKQQIGCILDLEKTEFWFNHNWFSNMNLEEMIEVFSKVSASRLLQRRDFKDRLRQGKNLQMHEMIYPILQAYDSVVLRCDIEIGGSDQLFNLTAGRYLQKEYGQPPQLVFTTSLLPGLNGSDKMSKSKENYIAIDDGQMFAKLMSLSDESMSLYLRELMVPLDYLQEEYNLQPNPQGPELKKWKMSMAHYITKKYLGSIEATSQQINFETLFNPASDDSQIPILEVQYDEHISLVNLVAMLYPDKSNSFIRRLIAQGGVKIAGKACKEIFYTPIKETELLEIGKLTKRRIIFKSS